LNGHLRTQTVALRLLCLAADVNIWWPGTFLEPYPSIGELGDRPALV